MDKSRPCCSPHPPLPSSRSSSASSSHSLCWPTSSVAPDVEGAGHKARPARLLAKRGPEPSFAGAVQAVVRWRLSVSGVTRHSRWLVSSRGASDLGSSAARSAS